MKRLVMSGLLLALTFALGCAGSTPTTSASGGKMQGGGNLSSDGAAPKPPGK
jgi:hypothetical protein